MRIKLFVIVLGIISVMASCKSDDKADAATQKENPTASAKSNAEMTYEVRQVGKSQKQAENLSPGEKAKNQKELEAQKMKEKKAYTQEKKKNGGQKSQDDPSFPNIMKLVSQESVEKAIDVEAGKMKLKSKKHNHDMGTSRCVWRWNDSAGDRNSLNVILSRNPSPENYDDWAQTTLDRYINTGLSVSDGSTMKFQEINNKGVRYAWDPDHNMLKWFYNNEFSFNLTGFGKDFDKKNLLKLAEDINKKITQHVK